MICRLSTDRSALELRKETKLAESAGNAPASGVNGISFSGRVPPACIDLDSVGSIAWIRTTTSRLNRAVDYCYPTMESKLVSPAGLPPATSELEARHSVCLNYGELEIGRAPRYCPECLAVPSGADCFLPHARKLATRTGAAPAISCSTGRRVCCSSSESKWWAMVVTLHPSSSDLV